MPHAPKWSVKGGLVRHLQVQHPLSLLLCPAAEVSLSSIFFPLAACAATITFGASPLSALIAIELGFPLESV
jgi:hypothetical protein